MPYCPKCRYEYVEGIPTCADCDVSLVESLPDEPQEADSAVDDFVPCRECRDRIEASAACSLLQSQGIECWILPARAGGFADAHLGWTPPTRSSELVMVRASLLDDAKHILDELLPDADEGAPDQQGTLEEFELEQRDDDKPWYAR